LPLQAVLVEGVALLCGSAALLALAAFGAFGRAGDWSWSAGALAGLPLVFAVQLVLVYGLALGLCALQVVLRDTQQALGAAMTLALFATPVSWSPAALPGLAPRIGWIEANPFHHLLGAWRAVLIGQDAFPWASLGYALCCALTALIAGHALFRCLRPGFADEV
jgi:lipopolysaccharide transport system permease protein